MYTGVGKRRWTVVRVEQGGRVMILTAAVLALFHVLTL